MLSAGLNSLICPSWENLRHPYLKKCAHPQGLSEWLMGSPIFSTHILEFTAIPLGRILLILSHILLLYPGFLNLPQYFLDFDRILKVYYIHHLTFPSLE